MTGESASDKELTDPDEKPALDDIVEVASILAVNGTASDAYKPNGDESRCLNARL